MVDCPVPRSQRTKDKGQTSDRDRTRWRCASHQLPDSDRNFSGDPSPKLTDLDREQALLRSRCSTDKSH